MRHAIAADFEHDPTFAEQRTKSKMLLGWAINQLNERQHQYSHSAQSWRTILVQAIHWGAVTPPDGKKHHHGCAMEVDGFYRVVPTGPCTCGITSTPL